MSHYKGVITHNLHFAFSVTEFKLNYNLIWFKLIDNNSNSLKSAHGFRTDGGLEWGAEVL